MDFLIHFTILSAFASITIMCITKTIIDILGEIKRYKSNQNLLKD